MSKRYWDNEPKYKRILEILDDYWLTSADELLVNVDMFFAKEDGQVQRKSITWTNPNFGNKNVTVNNLDEGEQADYTSLGEFDRFWDECIEVTYNENNRVLRKDMLEAYGDFCKEKKVVPSSRNSLYTFLRGKGVVEFHTNSTRGFSGIAIKAKANNSEENKGDNSKMEEIVWFDKERGGAVRKHEDLSITSVKNGISIIVRNNLAEEISSTSFFRIGFGNNDRNRLFFMAADKNHGWKFTRSSSNPSTMTCQIRDDRLVDSLKRFEGDYNLDISEDNLFYIDRRNVI